MFSGTVVVVLSVATGLLMDMLENRGYVSDD